MRPELIDHLRCPACHGTVDATLGRPEGDHVMTGSLTCARCEIAYSITRGVPRMNRDLEGLEQVASAFDLQWKLQSSGALEGETLYGWTEEQDWTLFRRALDVCDSDLEGAMVLDAGCGTARFTRQIARRGAAFAIGVDVAASVDEAFDASRNLPNVHVVQGNVASLPFADGGFDLVWCRGVLHHTPDAAAGHRELARVVRPGAKLYVWVYSQRFSPFRLVKEVLDALRVTRLPPRALFVLCRLIAYPSLALLAVYRLIRRLPGLRPTTPRGERITRSRGLREVQLTWFDALAPEHNSRHTEDEVKGWFRSVGFEHVASLDEPKIGVRGVKPSGAR
jgi:SAM-dependent methyltransferase